MLEDETDGMLLVIPVMQKYSLWKYLGSIYIYIISKVEKENMECLA